MIDQFSDEQRRWVEAYCNETISPEEFALFEKALEESTGFRMLTRRYLTMDAHLQQGADKIVPITQAWSDEKSPPENKRLQIASWSAAAAIVFLLGMMLGGMFYSPAPEFSPAQLQEDDGIAIVEYATDAVWEVGGDSALTTGSILSPGRLKLAEGLAQLEFYNGAQLILEGPVDLDLQSVDRVICHGGKLRALVPASARGFTVLSSQFELVDLGTEFGVEVASTGEAKVQVFDGEVDLYPPNGQRSLDQKTKLLGGSGLSWTKEGEREEITSQSSDFATFAEVKTRDQMVAARRFRNWTKWSESVSNDPRVAVHYDFEGDESRLLDQGPSSKHGTIIGSERTRGRWPEKGALEFKRPGDRVRIDIPGEFDELTLAAWIRVDALTGRHQSLLLTDEYRLGHVHWQIRPEGTLRFSTRTDEADGSKNSGYTSKTMFGPRRIGVWTFVATVFDRSAGKVNHYLNGREISSHSIVSDMPLLIGQGDIANWSVPLVRERGPSPVRNFVGRIDEMIVWRAALSSDEILESYHQSRP